MTTKHKIICGFLIMMLLLGTIAFLGYSSLNSSTKYFKEYDRLTQLSLGLNQLESELISAARNVDLFMNSHNKDFIVNAHKNIDYGIKLVNSAMNIADTKQKEALQAIMDDLQEYKKNTVDVQKIVIEARALYDIDFNNNSKALISNLEQVIKGGRANNNTNALYYATEIWHALSTTFSSSAVYADSVLEEDEKSVELSLIKADESLQAMSVIMLSELARKDYSALIKAFNGLKTTFEQQRALKAEVVKDLSTMTTLRTDLVNKFDSINAEIMSTLNSYGKSSLENNSSTQSQMLVISIFGILLGLAFALYIIMSLVKILNQTSSFARSIAAGDFNNQLKIHEKGEFGAMQEAMGRIPVILSEAITSSNNMSAAITSGKFRNRLDTKMHTGAFAELEQCINNIADSYTKVFDNLSLGIITVDPEYNIQFMNTQAQTLTGGNHSGKRCSESLQTGICSTANCVGNKCMSEQQTFEEESSMQVRGEQYDMHIMGTPMLDQAGAVIGLIEVLTDVTEIKRQEALNRQVAHEASHISDRLASASEELAAQVEQISRGAEVQRERIESTASAMHEMNATVADVARNASKASEQGESTRHNAEAGNKLVGDVVLSINTINGVAIRLQNNMQELGNQTENIGGVMNVISDIADQTNLLALNAAIEAARAGEAGRGFAVVADEVRKLAEKTMQATQEVGTNIRSMQNAAQINVQEVNNAVISINEATELANSSGQALQDIVHLVTDSSQIISSIAAAAEEQSASSEEINRSISEVNQIVGETTEGMVQSSAAVQELSSMAQELRQIIDKLQ